MTTPPTMPYSTPSPADAAQYQRLAELRTQTGDMLTATEALILETSWKPKPRVHRELECGCDTSGKRCQRHWRPDYPGETYPIAAE